MDVDDFDYALPESLIAQYPAANRRDARLLFFDGATGVLRDLRFSAFPSLLEAGDLLVFNDTQVIAARLYGFKETGGAVEVMVERLLSDDTILAMVKASKSPKPGSGLRIHAGGEQVAAQVVERRGTLFVIQFPQTKALAVIASGGHVPLPPYVTRPAEPADRERYQTVYARRPGAVAAPTAGLHFDERCLDELHERGVEIAYLTLHVGSATFAPLRHPDISTHTMHQEWFEVPAAVCDAVAAARARNRRVVAVGTTSVRALESACPGGRLQPFTGETDLFLYPGKPFRVVDAMLTNFHLPRSTLLMLVCAFGGIDGTLRAYRHAVAQDYRFFSYGDTMFVTPQRGLRRE